MAEVMPPPQRLELSIESPTDEKQNDGETKMPSPSSGNSTPTNPNNPRRPPRKSTLTQQQRNQKRQRATQDQLMTLEIEFNKNPTPTALVRERIASDINMTERSVQIWFQNRRAKIKNIAKRSIESGEDCDGIPDSMRQYLAMQAYGPGSKGMAASMLGRTASAFGPYGTGIMMNADTATGKVVIQHFACRSLSIGSWRRVGQSTMDLVIFYSPDKACITYYINNENAGYKIEYPFAWIKHISLEQGDVLSAAEGASQRPGGLVIELTRSPKFYMDSSGSGGFYECGDFTEDQQATKIMVHHLGGPSKVLSGQLAKLISLDSYQNRHQMFDPAQFAISAPVSPMRPASQPNHLVHPHQSINMFSPESAVGLMGPPAPRGHKRQRSRSVPAAIDFSMLRHPMPSFLIQHEQQSAQPIMQDPNIFAPIPQYQHPVGFAPGPAGPGLSIDTSASYSMGMHLNGSMSATTANSPSEFGTPAFYTSAPPGDVMATQFNMPSYNNGFLQVDPAAMIGTSNTPISMSHDFTAIADHSPPHSGIARSHSADIFGTPGEQSHFGDDSLYLSDSFNKQMQLPFRSPLPDDSFQSGSFDFQSPPGTSGSQVHMPTDDQQHHLQFDGYQPHQDSGISFSTPVHVQQDHTNIFNSPKDSGMMYQDAKMFNSPGQMHLPEEHNLYQTSPLANGTNVEDLNMHNLGAYGTIDPHSLGQHHSH